MLEYLGQHINNIIPSGISPRTVNGLSIPLGKVTITIKLEEAAYQDDLHIYPGVSGALISWKATKHLGILPASYPYPEKQSSQGPGHREAQMRQTSCDSITENLVKQFPAVFDGNIHTMEGEKFHIYISCGQCCAILCKNTQNNSIRLQGQAKGGD